jgi:hypothetical protein
MSTLFKKKQLINLFKKLLIFINGMANNPIC